MVRNRRLIALPLVIGITLVTVLTTGVASGTTNATRFDVVLSGANEVPPADPDGVGMAVIVVEPQFISATQGLACLRVGVRDIRLPTWSHIHEGPAGVNGPIVLHMPAPELSGTARGCVQADSALLQAMVDNPAGYYYNVHNLDYPGGAVRGQLG